MKTISLKKVSAVAVASLGFGLLSVVPANAITANTSDLFAGTTGTTTSSVSVAVGTAATVDLTAKYTAGGADTAEAKLEIMDACGIKVTRNPSEMGRLLKEML